MTRNHGYALLETLLASIILATGLVSLASLFSVTTGVNIRNRQRTTATLLVSDKMEELQSTTSPAGGSLDSMHPATGYMEYVSIAGDGTILIDNANTLAPFLRLWEVEATDSQTVTVAVFGRIGGTASVELARATGSW